MGRISLTSLLPGVIAWSLALTAQDGPGSLAQNRPFGYWSEGVFDDVDMSKVVLEG